MLSVFPQLLFLAPVGLALIRIAAGATFVWMAYFYWSGRDALSREEVPVIGKSPSWLWAVGSAISFAIGALLLVGLWTQAASLLGAIVALKSFLFAKRYPRPFPFPRSSAFLLLAVCICLLLSGAGAFAFDLPL